MNDTVKEIIKSLEDRLNDVAYVQEHTKDWLEKRNALAEGHALYMAYDEACKIAGFRYECGRSIRDGKECDTYTAVYPTETEKTEPNANAETINEVCPHCDAVVEMQWNTETQGYQTVCPVCGKRLMLCDACQHRTDGTYTDDCDYDSRTDSCRFNPKVVNEYSNKMYCPALGGWIMHYDACRGGCDYDSETDTCKLYRNNTRKGGDA